MKTLITALAVSLSLMGSTSFALSGVGLPEMPTTFPQDGAFDGKGIVSIIVKDN